MKIFSTNFHAGDMIEVVDDSYDPIMQGLVEQTYMTFSPDGNYMFFSVMIGKADKDEPTDMGMDMTDLWLNRYGVTDRDLNKGEQEQ